MHFIFQTCYYKITAYSLSHHQEVKLHVNLLIRNTDLHKVNHPPKNNLMTSPQRVKIDSKT